MQKNVKITFWILLLCAGVFLVALNVRLLLPDRPAVLLALSPEKFELQEIVPEGTEFQAEFILENKTRSDLVVRKIISSCGCTGLLTKEGELIETPIVLASSKPFPILVTVDTKNMKGKRGVSVMVTYEHRRELFFSVGNIFFEVATQDKVNAVE